LEIGTVAIGRWVFEAGTDFLSENLFSLKAKPVVIKTLPRRKGPLCGWKPSGSKTAFLKTKLFPFCDLLCLSRETTDLGST
jgi:hypothetical protein